MKGLEMVKCESLRMNMYRITQTGKSMNFPVTTVNFVGLKEIYTLRKNASNVNVRKFATCNKERRRHLQRQLKCALEKQNLVFQHISDLCCYLLKLSGGIPYGIHE